MSASAILAGTGLSVTIQKIFVLAGLVTGALVCLIMIGGSVFVKSGGVTKFAVTRLIIALRILV